MIPAVPTFSYAQAAKGRSPPFSATQSPSKALSETTEAALQAQPPHEQSASSEEPLKEVKSRRTSESQIRSEIAAPNEIEKVNDSTKPAQDTTTVTTVARQPQSEASEQLAPFPPPSPSFGTGSTSTLQKEDDSSPTPNGSSESTWDKHSQGSQNGEKTGEKPEADKEQSMISSWEQKASTPSPLREAPPPALNFWQQRILEKRAKTSNDSLSLQPAGPTSSNNNTGQIGAPRKTQEDTVEASKQESKKKVRTSPQAATERSSPSVITDASKFEDAKHRNPEEEKNTHRRARSPEAARSTPAAAAPPPPGDAISWPTPERAQEEKKKWQDRGDKVEKADKEKILAAKPHGKEKWVPVPYVPSAVFETPLPPSRRGGRPARGGRDGGTRGGHVAHGSIGGDKSLSGFSGNVTTSAVTPSDRARGDMGPPSRLGHYSAKPKRSASAGPPTSREQRSTTDPALQEKRNGPPVAVGREIQNPRPAPTDSRRASTATQTENPPSGRHAFQTVGKEDMLGTRKPTQNGVDREGRQQSLPQDVHGHPRPAEPERRSEGSIRPPDSYFKDSNGFVHPRERGEARTERGRGGFRGNRGGNNGYGGNHSTSGQGFANGHSNHQSPTGNPPSKSNSYTERHSSQPQSAPFASTQPPSRSYRPGPRSQSIPNATVYGRYPPGAPPGTHHLPALQTDIANMYGYQPGHPGIMSAMPYHPYMEQVALLGMVQMQMEYYFSVDNLCKDMFLRKHMDSQGFVFLSVLVNFNRIKQLTSDIDLIRYVCLNSRPIEFQTGMDGVDRLRPREGWQQWVLSMDERDPTARNEGPAHLQQARASNSHLTEGSHNTGGRYTTSPRSSFHAASSRLDNGIFQSLNGVAPSFNPAAPASAANGQMSNGQINQTPLSAAVPDFAPGILPITNHGMSPLDPQAQVENSFSDEQVESLMIVIRKPTNSATPLRAPFHSAASRTFSNGSIDGRTISDELSRFDDRSPVPSINGHGTAESLDPGKLQRSRSPFHPGSPARHLNSNAPPVFWVKDKETPIEDLPSDLTHESYTVFRRNALKQREHSIKGQCHRDMDILYQFWSHFLIRNFNTRMYEEFRQLAFEDATQRESTVGTRNLVQYYDESVLGQKIISEDLARDYIDLVKMEDSSKDRLAFDKLRAAWRNGAFNLKNRKKMDNILDSDLKAELEG